MAKVGGLSAQELYKLISSHSSMPGSLDVLCLSFLRADISSLHAQVLLLEEVLLSRNELPLTKYHALLALQQLLQTARYPALLFLEIYIAPLLADISLCLTRKRSDVELEGYFIDRGYKETVGIRKLSQKFVQKAGSLIILAAAIKPYENVLRTEISVSSRFEVLAAAVREAGIVLEQDLSPKDVQALRIKFLKEVKGLNAEAFGSFIVKKLKEDIVFRQSISNSTRKLIDCEDAVLSIPAINLCVSMLIKIPCHFQQQKAYLTLFNSFIRQGHVYAIIVAHNASFISDIFKEVVKVPGNQGLMAGRHIYVDAEASMDDKLGFYCEFLKCLEIWAACLPQNEIGDDSDVLKYYTYLKEERMFVFPEILLLRRAQEEFNQCLEARELQNEQILKIIESDDKLMAEYAKIKSSVIELSIKLEQIAKPEPALKSRFTLAQGIAQREIKSAKSSSENASSESSEACVKMKSLVREGVSRLQELINESDVVQNMQALKSFSKEWPYLKENYQHELSPSIIEEGDSLKRKINEIYPLYLRYKKKSFSFNSFRKKVANIIGIQLQQSNNQKFDDYAFEEQISHGLVTEQKVDNKTIVEASKQSSFINLGCWSKLKLGQSSKENEKNISVLKKIEVNPGEQLAEGQPIAQYTQNDPQVNEYGIRQLLIKRKQYLSASKQSLRSKLSKESNASPEFNRIIPEQLLIQNQPSSNESSHISERSAQLDKQGSPSSQSQSSANNCSATSKRMSFSEPSETSTDQYQKEIHREKQNTNVNRMNVFEIYQLKVEGKDNSKYQKPKLPQNHYSQRKLLNQSQSIRSKVYLQKIRYSSTRKSIEDYSRKINSNKNLELNRSIGADNSIIHRQYKRLALQSYPQHHSLSRRRKNDCSDGNMSSSLFSNQSRKQTVTTLSLQKYSMFFSKDKCSKVLKNCIKSKGLLFSNEDVEIGFVHFRKDSSLSLILYLTASKNTSILQFEVSPSPHLLVHVDCSSLRELRKNRQEILKLDISIKIMPFKLPVIKMKMKPQGVEAKVIEVVLPCTFNKFIFTKFIDVQQYEDSIKVNQSSLLQTPKFKISNPQSFQNKISKFFSAPIPSKHASKGTLCALECSHQTKKFILKVSYEDKSTGAIIGHSPTQHNNEMQLLLTTLGFALSLF